MTLYEYLKTKPRGSLQAMAKRIGAHAPDLSRWASGERPVPIHFCPAIEIDTDGLVPRQELRDDWQRIWPELVEEPKREAA
jgi:DNA-binding transcriptional regulator YdaS (Cro superfamily)